MRSFRLLNAPDPKAIYFDLTWSAAGDRLTYAWRDLEHEEFYSVDPIAGVANSIPLQREFAADEFVEASYLLGNGELDGLPVQPIHESKDRIALERGASVQYANRKIVVAAPKQAARTIAAETTLAPGCGPSLSLMDAFNGRYVLYRASNVYWIYGLRENRKAILYRGAGVLEW